MAHPGQAVVTKCPRSLQIVFLRACAVTLLLWLVIYTLEDVNARSKLHSWRFSSVLGSFFKEPELPSPSPLFSRKRLLVLLWNRYFSHTGNWLPSTQDLQCPISECDTTSNRSLLENSSAVVIHWRNIDVKDLPPCDSSQSIHCPVWVLFNQESPPHTVKNTMQAVEGRVQWTATYRRDSDIFAPYGKVYARSTPHYSKTNLDPNKRLVCWLVSNCVTSSKREVFVRKLKDYIEVDTYGRCGNMKCPHAAASDCYRWLSDRCLFYLSVENSLCKDYTTEKVYYALSTSMIPVVMGDSANYRHLPPRSYINIADFQGPRELADYLLKVGKDQQLYQSYLSWKKNYEVRDHSYRWFCDLCEKLHLESGSTVPPRRNLVEWWFNQFVCSSWQNL